MPMADSGDSQEFDPLSVENVGVTLAVELLEQPLHKMPPERFFGAGVYALYYRGNHAAYKKLIQLDAGSSKYPIYIGKASGKSAKQGFKPRSTEDTKLFSRIEQHAASIEETINLKKPDFF